MAEGVVAGEGDGLVDAIDRGEGEGAREAGGCAGLVRGLGESMAGGATDVAGGVGGVASRAAGEGWLGGQG